jgi:hypothetical protein
MTVSFWELNRQKSNGLRTPSFLLANYSWIKAYAHAKTKRGLLPEAAAKRAGENSGPGEELTAKEASYRTAFDDFQCTFGVGFLSGENPLYAQLGNRAWREIKKDIYLRQFVKVMERTEYPAFIHDPEAYLRSTCLPRLYTSSIDDLTFKETVEKYYRLTLADNRIFEKLRASGRPYFNIVIISSPLDFLADFLRGTKELLVDLHSVPELVQAACRVIVNLILRNAEIYRKFFNMKHLLLPLHLPGILKRRDFEEFYYPTYDLLVRELVRQGYEILILFEGNVDRLIDIIAGLDSDQVLLHFESTAIEKYQAYFRGKATFISGFYPAYLLKYGSEEECLQAAAELREKVRHNDRFIFSTNKVLFTGDDVNYENLRKVYAYFGR